MPKYHPRIEAVGAIDEASAALGLGRAACQTPGTGTVILATQRDLYHIMAEIAAAPENAHRFRMIDASKVKWLEEMVDSLADSIQMPGEFIVPGDSPAGAALALARTIVRRAERRVAHLASSGEIENPHLVPYLNRLSSLCFLLELIENRHAGSTTHTLAKD